MKEFHIVNIQDLLLEMSQENLTLLLQDFRSPKNFEIESFLHNKAIDFVRRKLAVTYVVLDYDGEFLTIEQRNYFKVGDSVEIFGPGKEIFSFVISSMYDVDGNILEVARHPKEIIKIPIVGDFSRYDLMRKK